VYVLLVTLYYVPLYKVVAGSSSLCCTLYREVGSRIIGFTIFISSFGTICGGSSHYLREFSTLGWDVVGISWGCQAVSPRENFNLHPHPTGRLREAKVARLTASYVRNQFGRPMSTVLEMMLYFVKVIARVGSTEDV